MTDEKLLKELLVDARQVENAIEQAQDKLDNAMTITRGLVGSITDALAGGVIPGGGGGGGGGSTLTDGLISWWSLDEAAGNARVDSHGSNNTSASTTPNTTAKIINGYDAANHAGGSAGRARVTSPSGSLTDGGLTVAAWVNYDGSSGNVFTMRGDGVVTGAAVCEVRFLSGRFRPYYKGDNSVSTNLNEHAVGTGDHLVVVSFNPTDGKLYASVDNSTLIAGSDSTVAYTAGWGYWDIGENNSIAILNGWVDELAIWGRAITQDEISEIWNNGDGIAYPG
jgi:hypothetical protein